MTLLEDTSFSLTGRPRPENDTGKPEAFLQYALSGTSPTVCLKGLLVGSRELADAIRFTVNVRAMCFNGFEFERD